MKLWTKILLGVLAIILLFLGRTLVNSGFFTTITPHFNGSIAKIEGFNGGEDIVVDQAKGLAIISAPNFTADNNGGLFLLNLNETNPKPKNLSQNLPFNRFHPHGISLYQSPDGTKKLFVVNHRNDGQFIEIFTFTDSTLVHLESISNPLIIGPNDVVAVGDRSFYFTNDHDEPISATRDKKDLLQIPMGNVGYFDGKNVKIMADKILYANGINKSNDGKTIYVASTSGQKIKVFDRNLSNQALTLKDEIAINGSDNIDVDANDDLWVGCHPKLLAYLAHATDHSKLGCTNNCRKFLTCRKKRKWTSRKQQRYYLQK